MNTLFLREDLREVSGQTTAMGFSCRVLSALSTAEMRVALIVFFLVEAITYWIDFDQLQTTIKMNLVMAIFMAVLIAVSAIIGLW